MVKVHNVTNCTAYRASWTQQYTSHLNPSYSNAYPSKLRTLPSLVHNCHSTLKYHIIIIIIKSFYSLWSIGHPWRASRHYSLHLSPLPRSMIFLCFLSHPLLSFTTFSLAYLSFYIPEDSNLMQFSLLLLFLYVMCVQSNSVFFLLSDFLLTSDGWFSIVLHS